jgi:hypothetical protein
MAIATNCPLVARQWSHIRTFDSSSPGSLSLCSRRMVTEEYTKTYLSITRSLASSQITTLHWATTQIKKRCNYCNLVKRCQQSLDQSKVCFLFLFSAFCRHLVLRPLCHVCIPILYLSVSVRKKENKNETDATNKNEKYKKNVPVSL